MTQAALKLDVIPELASLLERELSPERLASALDLDARFPHELWRQALAEPLGELASRPGKEFRARLVALCWRMAGGRGQLPAELPGIVEALHLGSLIVDDIEDQSPQRRGGPALHLMVGVPMALNAGNWLYFLPSVLVTELRLPRATELALRQAIDEAVLRCHYGQALDLSTRVTALKQRAVASVVLTTTRLKTGSLTDLASKAGAIAAGADPGVVQALGAFGRDFGIALQMLDDLTGLTSEKHCHKGHEDLIESRPTWPWAWLSEAADSVAYCRLRALAEEVESRDLHPEVLAEQLRDHVAERGFATIRERLSGAREALRLALGERPGFAELCEEIRRLEHFNG